MVIFALDHRLYVKYNDMDIAVFISLMLTILTSASKAPLNCSEI